MFQHLTKRKIVSQKEIHELLTRRYERQIFTFAAELRAFLTLPIAGPNTPPEAGEKEGGIPQEAVDSIQTLSFTLIEPVEHEASFGKIRRG